MTGSFRSPVVGLRIWNLYMPATTDLQALSRIWNCSERETPPVKALDAAVLPEYPAGHLLSRLEAENTVIMEALARMQEVSASARKAVGGSDLLRPLVRDLTLLGPHYVSLQNALFPLFEQASPSHACVKLMWTLEDDVLALRKKLCENEGMADEKEFWKVFGDFFVLAGSLAYRERRILFPVAWRAIPETHFARADSPRPHDGPEPILASFASGTGSLSHVQLEAILAVLPLDIAFIGSDDRVKFYSDPPHRIFPRNPAVIGRLVQNCHPPKSVATVEEILRSFKTGEKDSAEFWLDLHGKFVHIEYFAVRAPDGTYLGTLESSMDATHLRSIEGEKRLL